MVLVVLLLIVFVGCPALASHPLITDDPGTVPLGDIEFEQTLDLNKIPEISLASTTFTFGVADNVEAGIGTGYGFSDDAGVTVPSLAFKWRFIGSADAGFSSALSLTTQLATNPLIGEQIALLLGQYRAGNSTFLLNAGYSWLTDHPDHWDWALAAEYDTSPYTTLTIEASDTDFIGSIPSSESQLQYLLGVIYTDIHEYAYSAGIGYILTEDNPTWRFTTGITITY